MQNKTGSGVIYGSQTPTSRSAAIPIPIMPITKDGGQKPVINDFTKTHEWSGLLLAKRVCYLRNFTNANHHLPSC